MAKLKVSKLESLKFVCGSCGKTNLINSDNVSFYADSSECDLCGSHGSIEINTICPCGKSLTVEPYSW
jgi:predicted RNA-binding Zn-ribbon protein involved in translation (DUF1610 family)